MCSARGPSPPIPNARPLPRAQGVFAQTILYPTAQPRAHPQLRRPRSTPPADQIRPLPNPYPSRTGSLLTKWPFSGFKKLFANRFSGHPSIPSCPVNPVATIFAMIRLALTSPITYTAHGPKSYSIFSSPFRSTAYTTGLLPAIAAMCPSNTRISRSSSSVLFGLGRPRIIPTSREIHVARP